MPNIQSKPLVQSTIDIYEARTSQGHFRGFGLSNLSQNNTTNYNYAGANINNGNGIIISGSAQVNNSLNTNTTNGAIANKNSSGSWGHRSDNRYRADYSGDIKNYANNRYYNGDRADIVEKQRQRSKVQSSCYCCCTCYTEDIYRGRNQTVIQNKEANYEATK
jgi:hypothetical protein